MSKNVDILKFTADELTTEKLAELVRERFSFSILQVKDISTVVSKVEGEIEKQDLKCRVYTEYRAAAIGGVIVPTGVTQVAGVATAVGIGLHNLVTFNPDYEIGKNAVAGTVTVSYKRDRVPEK